jgi:hypothetical protein
MPPKIRIKNINIPILKIVLWKFSLIICDCFKALFKKYFTPGSVNIGLVNSSKFIFNIVNFLN